MCLTKTLIKGCRSLVGCQQGVLHVLAVRVRMRLLRLQRRHQRVGQHLSDLVVPTTIDNSEESLAILLQSRFVQDGHRQPGPKLFRLTKNVYVENFNFKKDHELSTQEQD